jgi:hypothetical protein
MPTDVQAISREHVEALLAGLRERAELKLSWTATSSSPER